MDDDELIAWLDSLGGVYSLDARVLAEAADTSDKD